MSETTLKLLELIKEGKKLNEICTELNKTPKQIFNHLTLLKNKGYLFWNAPFRVDNIKKQI